MKRFVMLGALLLTLSVLAPPASAQTFDECGFLVQGVECILFQSDLGGLYVVNSGGFTSGEYIRVTGTFDPSCVTICQQGNGCVFGGPATLCGVVDPPQFIRGDSNADGGVDISDPIATLTALFTVGSGPLSCADAGDANDDGALNIADPIFTLAWLFSSGPLLPPPFPSCGFDPTDFDPLDCDAFAACP